MTVRALLAPREAILRGKAWQSVSLVVLSEATQDATSGRPSDEPGQVPRARSS